MQVTALLVAAVLGAATSEAVRGTDPPAPDADVLSLEVDGTDVEPEVATTGGAVSLLLPVVVRNAGPTDVVLQSAELSGTALRDDSLDGRVVAAGKRDRLVLRRSVDCRQESGDAALTGPLRVVAAAGGNEQQIDLRLDDAARRASELAQATCGAVPPSRALDLDVTRGSSDHGVGRLDIDVRNRSVRPLQVRELVPAPGLRVRLVRPESDEEVTFPLDLPVGGPGFREPVLQLRAVLVIDDCGSPLPGSAFPGGPIFELVVADDERVERVPFGVASRVISSMEAESCP